MGEVNGLDVALWLVLGLGMFTAYHNINGGLKHAYATNVVNCDKPYKITQDDLDVANTLPPKDRQAYLRGIVRFHIQFCQKERRRRIGDETHGPLLLDPTFPLRGKSSRTKTLFPVIPDLAGRNTFSEFAQAYASTQSGADPRIFRAMSIERCVKEGGGRKCCNRAAIDGTVTLDAFNSCRTFGVPEPPHDVTDTTFHPII
jgi:hypothetical protein